MTPVMPLTLAYGTRPMTHTLSEADSKALLAWLDGGHIAEVVSQPGFRWAKRYRLEQDAEDGWHAYAMIYGVDSKTALEAYFVNPIHEKFKRENARFTASLRTDRMWGATDFSHAKR